MHLSQHAKILKIIQPTLDGIFMFKYNCFSEGPFRMKAMLLTPACTIYTIISLTSLELLKSDQATSKNSYNRESFLQRNILEQNYRATQHCNTKKSGN